MPRLTPQQILSQALAPFQSFTRTSPRTNRDTIAGIAPARPFRGLFPFDVCQPRGATETRQDPSRRLRCALRVSHPLDALLPSRPSGFVPSRYRPWGLTLRGLNPQPTPYVLSNAAPLWGFSPLPQDRSRPFRDPHAGKSPSTGLGFSQVTAPDASLGFPASRYTARNDEERSHAPSSPHALIRTGLTVTGPPAPQGILRCGLDRSLSRSINPRAVFHLVGILDSLVIPQGWAYGFPSGADPRRRESPPRLRPAVRPPA